MSALIIPGTFGIAMQQLVWLPGNDGQGYHNDPRDPGGATSWGVTYDTWLGWQLLHDEPTSPGEFETLPQAGFLPIYHTLFWGACRCDELPAGVAISVFDASCGSAPGHAIRFVQHVVGVAQDGVLGPVTMAAIRSRPAAVVINGLADAREDFYSALPTFRIYGKGWDRRAEQCRALSLAQEAAHA